MTKVLTPYSARMKKLLEDPASFYKPNLRPSGHDIGTGFAKDNGGAIPSNLLQISNSESNGQYLKGCKIIGARPHPARFPARLPEFFIKLLTEPDDVVLDIFAGSNTTGQVAERAKRRWLAFERSREYVAASALRFLNPQKSRTEMRKIYDQIEAGKTIDLDPKSAKRRSAAEQRKVLTTVGNVVSAGTHSHPIAVLLLAERDKLDRAIEALERNADDSYAPR